MVVHRFLEIEGRLHLVMVKLNLGQVVDVVGKVECIGDPNRSAAEVAQGLVKLAMEALHGGPVLQVADLPEDVQKRLFPAADPT